MTDFTDNQLNEWQTSATFLEQEIRKVIVGQDNIIHLITISLFSRGHVLLEGDVGVGKTTMLRAFSRAIGGGYTRIEGTVDLMPNDLLYYTYLNEQGKPQVDPGPLLQKGENLSTFFFNEINRARPQVHALLLRAMAERSVTAFNRDFFLPHLQVFADRNRLEKEETFELPSAARDRFLMELTIKASDDLEIQRDLMTNHRYHNTDKLIKKIQPEILKYSELSAIGDKIQQSIQSSKTLQDYILNLCKATHKPEEFGIKLDDIDMPNLVKAGVSPRGMGMVLRAARVSAWLRGCDVVTPEDVRTVFKEVIGHRIFFTPVYELQRDFIEPAFLHKILQHVATP